MSLQKIKISSADRFKPGTTTPANFVIHSRVPFEGIYQLHWLYCPLTFPNINSRNNKIYFREGGIDKIAAIEPGFYSGYSLLIPKAVDAMNLASAGVNTYTMNLDAFTGLLTIESDSVEFRFDFTNIDSSAAEVLGFSVADYASAGLSLTSSRCPNLSVLQSVNIDVNGITTIHDTQHNNHATFSIPILVNLPGICYWTPPENSPQYFEFTQRTSTLAIKVTDDDQQVLPLQSEWHMVVSKVII